MIRCLLSTNCKSDIRLDNRSVPILAAGITNVTRNITKSACGNDSFFNGSISELAKTMINKNKYEGINNG